MADRDVRRVLVTGVAGALAATLARRLARHDTVAYVAGLDTEPPPSVAGLDTEPPPSVAGVDTEPPPSVAGLDTEPPPSVAGLDTEPPPSDDDGRASGPERMEFVRGDLRSAVVPRLLESASIDTLVHLGLQTSAEEAGGRARMKEFNVIGSMQLLAAAQNAPSLRRVLVRSSTAVYGSSHRNPALVAEDATVSPSGSGYAKDIAEVEGYARRLARHRTDVSLSVLRLAHLVGPAVDSPLTRYFALPVAPTVLGYDPRLQLLDADDAVEVMAAAALAADSGIFNVGGHGAMYLSQALRLAGRPPLPVAKPLMPLALGALRRAGLVDFSEGEVEFLMHGRVADTSRLREQFGLAPRYSTREAFERFLAARGIEPVIDPEALARAERWGLRALAGREVVR